MATSPSSNEVNGNQIIDIPFSYFRKTVSLRDWWLIKADDDYEGKRLAVAGFTCGEERSFRVFNSAPITKRRDNFTLEAADGIIVILQGFINVCRTTENGFPSEVFSHFLFDFPCNWEDYAEKYIKQVVTAGMDSTNTSCLDKPTNNSESESEENRDGSETHNTLMATQSPTSLGCVDEEVVEPIESLPKLPVDCQDAEQPSNNIEDAVVSSAEKTDAITASKVKLKRGSKARLCNPRNQTRCKIVEDLKKIPIQKNVTESPMKHKIKECSHSTLHADINVRQAMLKASKALRNNSSDSLKNKENTEQISVKRRRSSPRKAKRRIIFDTPVESLRTQESKEKIHVVSPESFRRSRSGRLLLPSLEFWRNQLPIYDADRNITGIQEELSSSAGSNSYRKKKQKKRH